MSLTNTADLILDYNTMQVSIGKKDNIDYDEITTIKNRKEKSKWTVWTCGKNLEKWNPTLKNIDNNWCIPILKSNLQKAVKEAIKLVEEKSNTYRESN